MEALILAAALRMVGPAMQQGDTKLEQPQPEPGPALAGGVTPWGAVVHEEGLRQSIAAERRLEPLLHGAALLIGAGLQTQAVARVIVDYSERMAAAAIRQCHMTLEVHLPEQVRRGFLKPLMDRSAADRPHNAPIPAQDLMHRRDRGHAHPVALKAVRKLARSPGGMRIA